MRQITTMIRAQGFPLPKKTLLLGTENAESVVILYISVSFDSSAM